MACAPSCTHQEGPQAEFDRFHQDLVHGDLKKCQDEAEAASRRYLHSNPEWSWRFRALQAESMLWEGLYGDTLKLLGSAGEPTTTAAVPVLALSGQAHAYLHRFPEADAKITGAERLCASFPDPRCGDVIQARGILYSQQGNIAAAEKNFQLGLVFARAHNDSFLEATSLLNLGAMSLEQGHYDEAVQRSTEAQKKAEKLHAPIIELVTQGNIAWACYKLGDSVKALDLSTTAEKLASSHQDVSDQENELTNIGYIYMDRRQPDRAEQFFHQALRVAQDISAKEDEYNALRVLARLALQQGNPDAASDFADQALAIAKQKEKDKDDQKDEGNNRVDELYPTLVLGQVAARRGDSSKARQIFDSIEHDADCPPFLRWEAQHSLARLFEDMKQPDAADRAYRAALATFESTRANVQQEDFQLSFLTNAAHIYDDYIHFLISQGKTDDALRWADNSRARSLIEGLGLLTKADAAHTSAPLLNARDISRRAKGVLLFYWIGENQSYLWAITPQKTSLFTLPPAPQIDTLVQHYREDIQNSTDLLTSTDGRALYNTLIAPAQALLTNNSKIFLVPDGALNNLNFETLIVAGDKPRFWIEDARLTNVSSLRVLLASLSRGQHPEPKRNLLLIGNSIAPTPDYRELPRAAQQMSDVARHFTATQKQIFDRDKATPSAYLNADPGKFSYIHFVAHGTASRLSPLDSAIILSRPAPDSDAFKLYAHDIIQRHLHANLVTISSCYGAGERAYTGEGLVGLAWAFLRAGAHNVIASLWEVTDASTEQLMDRFYDELDKGAPPDEALRTAKLSLLRGTQYRNPYYWAPFLLYTGS